VAAGPTLVGDGEESVDGVKTEVERVGVGVARGLLGAFGCGGGEVRGGEGI
jgi:hypothetical protein